MATTISSFLSAFFFVFLIVILPFPATAGKEDESPTLWAVLIAGSYDYLTYGHQADVCHAYQLLKNGGVKEENMIVFMYDDIANNPRNPRPGIIINNPQGEDVYSGVPKDYTRKNATAENLMAVLLGNRSRLQGGSGKVLDSKPDDRIFIFYSGDGGLGVLVMPDYSLIFANEFMEVLKKMHATSTYRQMVIYFNGPGSGALFDGILPTNLNIYATTSSSSSENTMYMTYCPSTHPPPPPEYDVCIANLYSVSWMEDSEMQNRKVETLGEQFEIVKNRTYYNDNDKERGTRVSEYGTLALRSKKLHLFQGFSDAKKPSAGLSNFNNPGSTGVDLQRKYNKEVGDGSEDQKAQLVTQIGVLLFGSEKSDLVLGAKRDEGLPFVDDWGCLKSMVHTFELYCKSPTRHTLKFMQEFANMCNNGVAISALEAATKKACRGG